MWVRENSEDLLPLTRTVLRREERVMIETLATLAVGETKDK